MQMDFGIEISGILIVLIFKVYLNLVLIPKNEKVQNFIIRHKKYLSPNSVSNWRKYLGIPTIGLLIYGIVIQDAVVIYATTWIFTFLALSDWTDGVIARSCDMKTEEGAILDAEADKWFDLPPLISLSILPFVILYLGLSISIVFTPMYIPFIIILIVFDIIGQTIRGKNSPPEASIVGKAKTTIKFITIYMMSINGRYPEVYIEWMFEIIIMVLLIISSILAGISMGMKTKWYRENLRKNLEEFFA